MMKIQIIGRLGQDCEVKQFNDNQVINFSVAVSERWTNKDGQKQEKTIWTDCSKWSNNTNIAQYLTKGVQVYVEGTPECRAYVNKEGEAVAVQGVRVFNIELLGGGADPGAKPQPKHPDSGKGAYPNDDLGPEGDNLPF